MEKPQKATAGKQPQETKQQAGFFYNQHNLFSESVEISRRAQGPFACPKSKVNHKYLITVGILLL
jgi:hypothetical protein